MKGETLIRRALRARNVATAIVLLLGGLALVWFESNDRGEVTVRTDRTLNWKRQKPKNPAPQIAPNTRGKVVYTVDGDTFEVETDAGEKVRVRARGIDCPESHENEKCRRDAQRGGQNCAWQIPRGRKAARIANRMLRRHSVTLESGDAAADAEPGAHLPGDVYGRVLAYLRLDDGRDYGLYMVKKGYCTDFSSRYPHPREVEYRLAAARRNPEKDTLPP